MSSKEQKHDIQIEMFTCGFSLYVHCLMIIWSWMVSSYLIITPVIAYVKASLDMGLLI